MNGTVAIRLVGCLERLMGRGSSEFLHSGGKRRRLMEA